MPRAIEAHPTFEFPVDKHLIITTSSGIFSWDSAGIKRIFSSSKRGILAAREAKDGSQLLAVADKHVVVFHDCKRGREESWGLTGGDEQVRLLEYAPDTKSLFLSTSMTGALQQYSIHESRLLDPLSNHPSPPTVLAVSHASHLVLSASENPPVAYLQNLTLNTTAVQLLPSASNTAVVSASFHPERPNIFLLAFKDGTLAAYDALRMARRTGVRLDRNACLSTDGRAGEIAHFQKLHRITNAKTVSDALDGSVNAAVGSKSVGITGAAFLPGYKTRAVSVGADGRCRMVDFEAGGRILRTWHAQAPITSLSISACNVNTGRRSDKVTKMPDSRQRSAAGKPKDTDLVIAVGRVDGQVLLFDSLGLRLDQIVVSELGEKIISVEWMKGPSPSASWCCHAPSSTKKTVDGLLSPRVPWTGKKDTSPPTALNLSPAARFPSRPTDSGLAVSFADAEDLSTVRHNPAAAVKSPVLIPDTSYLDLFSPVKKALPPAPQQKPMSPGYGHHRARLSSQTFVKESPQSTPRKNKHIKESPKTPKQLSMHPLSTAVPAGKASPARYAPVISSRSASKRAGTKSARKRAANWTSTSSGTNVAVPAATTRNGQVLADLRRLGAGTSGQDRKNTNSALFAPYMNRTGVSNLPRLQKQHENDTLPGEKSLSPEQQKQKEPYLQPLIKVDVSDFESHSSDRDIWLTAGSCDDDGQEYVRKRPIQCSKRMMKTARASPQAAVTHKSPKRSHRPLFSHFSPDPKKEILVVSPRPQTKGKKAEVLSMSEEAMFTAVSHLSNLDGQFVPTSGDVRKLFPRGSSLSSPASPRRSPRKHGTNCQGCVKLTTRVRSLEEEVAKLKAEVSVLRSTAAGAAANE